jgi:hypothetical protein
VTGARRRAAGEPPSSPSPDAPGDEGPATSRGSRLNLLPEADVLRFAWWRRWRLWLPLALVAFVLLVAVLLPIWQRGYVIAFVADRQSGARPGRRHRGLVSSSSR